MEVVLDANVLAKFSQKDYDARRLLNSILDKCWCIAIDYHKNKSGIYYAFKEKGKSKYQKFISKDPFLKNLIKEYGKKGKIKYRKSSRIELDCEIKEGDLKYLEVALNTEDKILITEDSDFLNCKEEILEKYGIRILRIREAREMIESIS